jgi:integrase
MDFDGEEWIITRRTKTRVSSNVPLMEIAKELIERYRGLAGGDLVFPMPSNSVCNRHLKQIAKACGIHKEIGFHLSRHTFATTVYLCNGGTIEALSKILGHKHISTTQIYAEVTNRMVSSDFRAISGNLAAMQRSVLEKKDRKQDGKRVRRSLRERLDAFPRCKMRQRQELPMRCPCLCCISRCTPPCVYVGLFPRLRFGRMST